MALYERGHLFYAVASSDEVHRVVVVVERMMLSLLVLPSQPVCLRWYLVCLLPPHLYTIVRADVLPTQ